jgi:hypothetical protein
MDYKKEIPPERCSGGILRRFYCDPHICHDTEYLLFNRLVVFQCFRHILVQLVYPLLFSRVCT